MNLNSIIQAWENNALPADITVLDACKKEIDNCEKHAFEAWRTTTNKAMAKMLMNELILYADVSVAIQSAISNLNKEQSFKAIANQPFTFKYAY